MTMEETAVWERGFLKARECVQNLAFLRYLIVWLLGDRRDGEAFIPNWLIPELRLLARGCPLRTGAAQDWFPNLDGRLRYPADRLFPQFALGRLMQPLQREWVDFLRNDVGIEMVIPEEGEPVLNSASGSAAMDSHPGAGAVYTTDPHRHLRVAGPCAPGKAGWRAVPTGIVLREAEPPYWVYRPDARPRARR
jgi:hypothetical protein